MEKYQLATLGGGCFWCLEAAFQKLQGVRNVSSGYSGGHKEEPTYKEVCTGETGHAEVVQIEFDSDLITYRELLEVFFFIHNPTTLNRQGADIGTQYRSVIFFHDQEQKKVAEEMINQLEDEAVYEDPIVTQLVEFDKFYPAEDYHSDYYENNKQQPYCNMVISPKLSKFRKKYREKLKD
ncbi:MAG: peptide-methionine (S)-S-oxide reductase MsrA [Halanaerobiales bacterium]